MCQGGAMGTGQDSAGQAAGEGQGGGRDLFAAPSVPVAYQRFLEPVMFAPWAERLVEMVGISPGDAVLDVACGTGAAALRAGSAGRVVATDLSQGMLDQLLRAEGSLAPVETIPIETIQCPATALRVGDKSFDVVLCQQGLHSCRTGTLRWPRCGGC